MIDKCAMIPILACFFSLIAMPLLGFIFPPSHSLQSAIEPRPENRIVWPALAAISVVLAIQNRSRLGKPTLPPNIICLLTYLAFAGASVLWAFRPEISFTRFAQQAMVVTSIVLPAMLASRTIDLMRGVFLCFAVASILNVFFVLNGSSIVVLYGAAKVAIGYPGYFSGKNYLGECAAITFLFSIHELLYPGLRRTFGIIIIVIAILLVVWSSSKTAFGLALIAPLLAGLTLFIGKATRISLAIILLAIPMCLNFLSKVSNFSMARISFMLYGDSTFTGRTIIWDFAQRMIEQRPLTGWGYQSFWLVGPDAPSILEAPGFVKIMPNAHSGYYDTTLEIGYVGFALLIIFLIANLHGIGRMATREPRRAWLVLSLALYIILWNFLESLWMRGFEFLWVTFLIVTAEVGRYWQPLPQTRVAGRLLPSTLPRTTRSRLS
jgi:exopolysaccharide production protein ExoQ